MARWFRLRLTSGSGFPRLWRNIRLPCSVSTSRSSNRTCGFPASGSPTGLTHQHTTLCFVSVVTPKTSQSSLASKVLFVTAEPLMELIGMANLRTLGLFQERARSQAPFLHRRYPASSVVRACPSPQTAQPAPHGVLAESHDLSPPGFPVLPVVSSFTHAIATTPAEPVESCRS